MKKQFIEQFQSGIRVDDIFVLAEKSIRQKKNGDNYLDLVLLDKTGTIEAKVWDQVNQIGEAAQSGDIVHVIGTVSEYRDKLQMVIRSLSCCDKNQIDMGDFLPKTSRNTDNMLKKLHDTVNESIQEPYIKKLLLLFFEDTDFIKKFKIAPAAKAMHHAYLGGLLEHTLSMTLLAKELAKHYSGVDLDMLLAGVILHDIGKVRELQYDTTIAYTDEGSLVHHIVIGCGMVEEKIQQIENFPKETAFKIRHMIVSHHGVREFGSPEIPKTIEAVLLHYIDNIDAKMNNLREFIAKQDPNEVWTSKNFMLGTKIYKGKTAS